MAATSQRSEPRHTPPLPAAPALARGANAPQPRPGPLPPAVNPPPRAAPIGLSGEGAGRGGGTCRIRSPKWRPRLSGAGGRSCSLALLIVSLIPSALRRPVSHGAILNTCFSPSQPPGGFRRCSRGGQGDLPSPVRKGKGH